jgi:hypothetical protein
MGLFVINWQNFNSNSLFPFFSAKNYHNHYQIGPPQFLFLKLPPLNQAGFDLTTYEQIRSNLPSAGEEDSTVLKEG